MSIIRINEFHAADGSSAAFQALIVEPPRGRYYSRIS